MIAALIAGFFAAVLAAGQILLSEVIGMTTLGVPLEAGAERVQGAQVTLVLWYCAVSAPIGAWVAHRDWRTTLGGRLVTALVASSATLAALPVVRWRAVDHLRDDVSVAVLGGALLGLAVAWWPDLGRGVAAHLALLWTLALCLSPLSRTVFYAGLIEPRDIEPLGVLRRPIDRIALLDGLDYHLPWMLPGIVLVLALCALLARGEHRRTASRLIAVATPAAGPALAAAAYYVGGGQRYLWNGSAATIALGTALIGLLIAMAVVAHRRGRSARRRAKLVT